MTKASIQLLSETLKEIISDMFLTYQGSPEKRAKELFGMIDKLCISLLNEEPMPNKPTDDNKIK